MALAFDHFLRGLLITSGALIISPSAGYGAPNDNVPPFSPADSGKNKELNEKIRLLGIDESCFLENLKTSRVCRLNQEQMKNVNFPEKDDDDDDSELLIEGLDGGKTVTLTIETGYLDDEFPHGLRFTFRNTNSDEVNIKRSLEKTTLKPNVLYDYKISLADQKQLLRAWSLQSLGGKVGLNINDSLNNSSCTLGENVNNVNVWKSETEYVIGAKAKGDASCLMEAKRDVANHLEGFKFTVKGSSDITLTNGEGPSGGTTISKITKENSFYEIGPKDINGTKKWFLIERTTS